MAVKRNGLSREFIIHPGETLKEMLEIREMSQRELAIRTGVTEKHVSNVVNCQKPISVSFAKKLEYALGVDASFWINLQTNFDKELADLEEINTISNEELDILKKLRSIIKYIQQLGFLHQEVYGAALVIELRKLLNISSLTRIPEVSQSGAYRLASSSNVDPYILFAWLRICELISDRQQIEQKLDINKLKAKLNPMKSLMFENVNKICSELKNHFAECGIKFSTAKHFRGAPVQGVIKTNNDGTLSLIMTIRRKFADIFWFTLFHEVGHIINRDFEDRLIDYDFIENDAEDKADEFAANILIDPEKYERFVRSEDYSLNHIKRFCAENNIPPFILIGRLQNERYLSYHQYSAEKVRYEWQ